jgi:hypothetical protein
MFSKVKAVLPRRDFHSSLLETSMHVLLTSPIEFADKFGYKSTSIVRMSDKLKSSNPLYPSSKNIVSIAFFYFLHRKTFNWLVTFM